MTNQEALDWMDKHNCMVVRRCDGTYEATLGTDMQEVRGVAGVQECHEFSADGATLAQAVSAVAAAWALVQAQGLDYQQKLERLLSAVKTHLDAPTDWSTAELRLNLKALDKVRSEL